ncbi:hypothetical protein [Paenibacillus apis]|uniref:Uncharacterized protein n=1 Tax=Paenibacillus apis TaxID=1792174 RepID=A0A919Y4R8_9BACL|nr:hypothetical protein [Paenibacillus apis]GIO43268.1 hypothetical protein J41TS4_30260 [Paenibacillus apis]
MLNTILKWLLILCAASLLVNGLLFAGTGNRTLLVNVASNAGLGVVLALYLGIIRKKQ